MNETKQPDADAKVLETNRVELGPKRYALLLLALFVLTYWEPLFQARTFVYRDFGAFGFPLASYLGESWRLGEIPLWNPYSNCGIPFLAQWNTMSLYPLSAIFVALPVERAVGWFCLLHLYAGAFGVYWLARRWSQSDLGAAIAGVSFGFSGLAFNCLLWPNNAAGVGWLPWVLILVEQAATRGGRWIPAAALAGGMQFLTGAPEVIMQTWLIAVAFCWWTGSAHPADRPSVGKRLGRVAVVAALVGGLAAAQMLPFLDLLQSSHRTADYAAGTWAMPWWGVGNFLWPLFNTFPWKSGVYYQPDQYWVSSYYVGAAIFVLAALGAFWVRKRLVAILAFAVAVALLLALGKNGLIYPLLVKILPVSGLVRFPVKFVIALSLLLPLLAAFAIARLEAAARHRGDCARRLLMASVVGLLLLAGLLVWMRLDPPSQEGFETAWNNGLIRAGLLVLFFATLWLALTKADRQKLPAILLLPVAVLWGDLSFHAPKLVVCANASAFQPDLVRNQNGPRLEMGQSRALLSREAKQFFYRNVLADAQSDFLGKRVAGFANCNLLDHLPKVDGFFSLYPRWHQDIALGIYARTNPCPENLADFLAVSHVTAEDDVFSWRERKTALPVIGAGMKPEFLEPEQIKAKVLDGHFDPRTTVLLPRSAEEAVMVTNAAAARTHVRRFSSHRIEVEAHAEAPAWVVIAQTDYPAWKALINGENAPIYRANHAFQAIQIPAGDCRLVLEYKDGAFRWGLAISLFSLVVCAGIFFVSKSGQRPAPEAKE